MRTTNESKIDFALDFAVSILFSKEKFFLRIQLQKNSLKLVYQHDLSSPLLIRFIVNLTVCNELFNG